MSPLRAKKHSIPLICMNWKERRTEEEWVEYFRDDFDDAAIDAVWTEHKTDANRVITETTLLTIDIASTIETRWSGFLNEAPKLYQAVPSFGVPFVVEAKLPAYAMPTNNMEYGIFIGHYDGDRANEKCAFKFRKVRGGAGGKWISVSHIHTQGTCEAGSDNYSALDEDADIWLRIAVDAAEDVRFYVSDDGESWYQMRKGGVPYAWSGFYDSDMEIGVFNGGQPVPPATTSTFEYFLINRLAEVGEFTTNEECISFEDVRAPDRVYAGRLKTLSPMKRSFADKTGLYQISDMNMVLANADRYYSDRAASGILKNQEVEIYHAWTEDPEVNRVLLMRMFIEDYSLKGNEFHIKMKDVTQKYFSKKIPANICTVADFPDIHPDHVGRYMPEVLGECVVGAGYDRPGAVEAVFIDTTGPPYVHLASRGELNDVTAVYRADGDLIIPANWTFIAGPPSTISINHADGNGTVYFDAEGYFLPAWDSTNGYIQNLVYIIEYLLHDLMEMPLDIIEQASFDDLAAYFDDQGWGTNGFLIIQKRHDAMEILRQLLFTGEIKGYVAKGGKFTVDIKDINDYEITSTDSHLFTQTDLLRAPERQWNLTKAINTVNARFGYIPWQQLWIGAGDDFRENFYDAEMEEDVRIPPREEPLPV